MASSCSRRSGSSFFSTAFWLLVVSYILVAVLGGCDDIKLQTGPGSSGGAAYQYGCHPGYYCDYSGFGWYGFGDCKECPVGHRCPGGQGNWSVPNPARNHTCDPGQYTNVTGNHNCHYCDIGKYSPSHGSTWCLECDTQYSPVGSYSSSQCQDSCAFYEELTDCAPCDAANNYYYQGGEKGGCAKCDLGTFLKDGYPSMPVAPFNYENQKQDGDFITFTQEEACTSACPPGTYITTGETGSISCLPCVKGRYSAFSDSTDCANCPTGRYRGTTGGRGAYECDECDAGKYGLGVGKVDEGACYNCPKGSYSVKGATECSTCPRGKSTTDTGTAYDESVEKTCVDCGKGKYDAGVGEGCTDCPVGRFTGLPGKTSCRYCQLGRFAIAGSEDCTDCGRGKFLSYPGSECLDCELGKYNEDKGQSECVKCPAGRWADLSDTDDQSGKTNQYDVCKMCPTGTYSPEAGAASEFDCIRCPTGKYSSQKGSSACTSCLPGKYGDTIAQESLESCAECFIDRYSLEGASVCSPCPPGYTTSGAKGSSSCTPPPRVLTAYEKTMNNFKNGLAYVVTMLVSGLFAVVAAAVYTLRSRDARLVPLTLVQTITKMMFSAISIVSEAFLLAMFFAKGGVGTTYGTVVLLFRLLHFVPTGIILVFVFMKFKYYQFHPSVEKLKGYREKFAKDHFLTAIYPYSVITLFACMDCTMIVFLPWYFTDFGLASIGFPNMFALRMTNLYKIIQDLVRFICNIAYITQEVGSDDTSVSAFFGLNIAISITGIVLSSMIAVMRAGVLYEIEKSGGTEVGSGAGKPGGGGEDALTAVNPLHVNRRAADPSISIREWLMLTMPHTDAPSIHAVDSAFKRDGILTLGDLMDCIRGQVIELSEVKTYTREGKLGKMDTLAIMKAIEKSMKVNQTGSGLRRLSGMFGGAGTGGAGEPAFSAPAHGSGGVMNRAQVRKSMMVSKGGGDEIPQNSPAMKELQEQYQEMNKAQIQSQERALKMQTEAIVGALTKLNSSVEMSTPKSGMTTPPSRRGY